jgi:hypothetical protein
MCRQLESLNVSARRTEEVARTARPRRRVTPPAHPSGCSANAALWAEMRYPVHGCPPTFAEHRNGVIVGVKFAAAI